jgi:hypothetical protein
MSASERERDAAAAAASPPASLNLTPAANGRDGPGAARVVIVHGATVLRSPDTPPLRWTHLSHI